MDGDREALQKKWSRHLSFSCLSGELSDLLVFGYAATLVNKLVLKCWALVQHFENSTDYDFITRRMFPGSEKVSAWKLVSWCKPQIKRVDLHLICIYFRQYETIKLKDETIQYNE